jgi:hypothetical protein
VQLRQGQRLRSQVCATEVIIVRRADTDVDLTCGGSPMVDLNTGPRPDSAPAPAGAPAPADGLAPAPAGAPAPPPALAGGNEMGKRYVTEDGSLEVLVTKAGTGTLAVSDTPLQTKEVKPLPSSD